jgi:hypothetical protein
VGSADRGQVAGAVRAHRAGADAANHDRRADRDGAGLRARGIYPLAYPVADLYAHAPWLHGFGGRAMDGEAPTIATAPAVAAAAFARELVVREVIPPDANTTGVATLFADGKAAMAVSGPWFLADIPPGVAYQVAPLPVVSATGAPAAPYLGTDGVLMSARATDKDAAIAVMLDLTSDDAAAARASTARQIVPNPGAYRGALGRDPVLAGFRRQLDHVVAMPVAPAMRSVWTPYANALAEIAGGAAPAAALERAAGEIDRYARTRERAMTDRGRALRDVAVLGALWLFALGALVRDRNHAAEARTRAQASAAASAVAAGERPLAPVAAAGVVGPASQRPDRPFLRRRTVVDADGRRPLGGPTAPAVDKLLYDAAARFDRDGAFVALLPDGSGRAVAAVATPTARPSRSPPAPRRAARCRGSRSSGSPGLVFGAVAVAATVGGRRVRIVCVGVAVGLAALPVARWGGPIAAAVVAVLGALAGWAHARGATRSRDRGVRAHRIALGFLAPAAWR